MNKPFLNISGKQPSPQRRNGPAASEPAADGAAPRADAPRPSAHEGAPAPHRPTAAGSDAAPARNAAVRAAAQHHSRGHPGQGGGRPGAAAQGGAGGRDGGQGTSHALMIGVFLLSALLGGGMAGLYLAFNDGSAPAEAPAIAGADAVVTPSSPAPAASTGAKTAGQQAVPAMPAKEQDRITATPASSGGSAPAVAAGAPAKAAGDAPREVAASAAGADELRQLTEQVIGALGALGRAERQGTVEEAASGAERLRTSLANLVDAALNSGKSDEEIRRLVAEALDSAGEGNIPALLRDASGKVDITRLLASIMPAGDEAASMPMNSDEREYFDQLAAEAGKTTTAERSVAQPARKATAPRRNKARAPRANGRFFVRDGKRYTIVRRGDTLSDIAFAAYGDVLAYSAILRANRGRISVRKLKPGTRILIPDVSTARKAKTRKRRARRQGAAPAPVEAARATAGKAATNPDAARKIITLPTAGQPLVDPAKPPVKYTNFRSSRDPQPVPLTPRQQK